MFVRMETSRAPLHIGCGAIFELPEGAGPGFVRDLHQAFAQLDWVPFPYDSVVDHGPANALSRWVKTRPDPSYHVRLSALPSPGNDAQLGQLIERLHSNPLDLSKPLWEAHVIEGLEGNRFAFYFKAHHGATDGLGAMRTIKQWLSTDPNGLGGPGGEDAPDKKELEKADRAAIRVARGIVSSLGATGEMAGKVLEMAMGANSAVLGALRTPRTPFNKRVTRNRRIAKAELDLGRMRAIAKATDTTVNDVVLTALAGSVRRYLAEQEQLPKRSLTASVPVGIDRDEETINAAAGFVCPLGTDIEDPVERLRRINAVTSRGKKELVALSPSALQQFTLAGLLPIAFSQKVVTAPPLFNFVVSNLVLSKEPLYLAGAKLVSMVPVSFLSDGYGLNVTLIGYGDKVTLGFVGCRDTIPHLQRLAIYTHDALDDLEKAAG
ncbi:wax ester/triacylglycerol synthase family O-acyltransferase [Nocardioides marmorisolisilvae]|uniref:Diacylglycerol O-acyltransferase n=2 Tax=Nocardioides marmorisolisilvae TaxID=1542737 RepID=A0A3N0DXQ2_9ACTN|nr:wax ester/triacylglycerol synthase family O-acyltransferase [Nocardioides marmorisolisilvae]